MLPEAVLRFRQGVGRLIRSATDRGAVIVADPRIVRSTYGSRFQAALPSAPRSVADERESVDLLARWFS
jgi:ATP-dependent DNA helicase DinG